MRILHQDRATAITAGSTLTGFDIANVQDDQPRNTWIAGATRVGETVTITLNASASYPIQSFFLHGLLADECTWELYNATTGGSVIDSGTLDLDPPFKSDLSGNPNTGNVYFFNQAQILRSIFVNFTTELTQAGRLVLTFSSNVSVQNQTISGAQVASWIKDSDDGTYSYGRLLDSGASAINIVENGRINVGSYIAAPQINSDVTSDVTVNADLLAQSPVTISDNVTLTIDDTYTLTITEAIVTGQILTITGDGTGTGAIKLDGVLPTGAIATVYNPIRLGIARVGSCLELPNPQSASTAMVDYSTRRQTSTGSYTFQQLGVGRRVSITMVTTTAQKNLIEDFARGYRAKPFAVQWLDSMPTGFEEEYRANLFGYLPNLPALNIINREISAVQLTFEEVI